MAEARAFWTLRPGMGAILSESLPEPGPGEALVRALASGVSRGTESLVFAGRVPESQHEAMRCPFQAGAFPGPVKYGYASVGTVEAGPPELHGRRVFCLHPHQDRYVVPADALLPVPDAVPDARAALAANLETAVNGLWDAGPGIGDRITVVGAGTVGGLSAALLTRLPGAEIELVDPSPSRAALAERIGARHVLPEAARGDCDLVIHASGTAEGLATALRLAGTEATILELSWYGDRPVAAPLGEAFHARRLTLRSSQVGMVPAARRARWSRRRRLALALSLLADPLYDAFLTGESAFPDLPAIMPRLTAGAGEALCHIVRYD